MQTFVFVYGTLRPGQRAHHRLGPVGSISAGSIRGRLYHLVEGYPAVIHETEGIVHGERVEIEARQLTALDAYEGSLYFRVQRQVLGADGVSRLAWCWVVSAAREQDLLDKGAILVPDGRWPVDGA